MKPMRILLLILLLLLLTVSCACAEKIMVIVPRAEDVYRAEQYIDSDTTVMVMTSLTAAEKETLNTWLTERGGG